MWKNVGIIREKEKMEKTLQILDRYEADIKQILTKGINKEILELQSLCTVAKLITKSALKRKNSIGTHYIQS